MAPKEDITPLVGGLGFAGISASVKNAIQVATRKLFHKTEESRSKGMEMLRSIAKGINSFIMNRIIGNTTDAYIREHAGEPDKAQTIIAGTALAHGIMKLGVSAAMYAYSTQGMRMYENSNFLQRAASYVRMAQFMGRIPRVFGANTRVQGDLLYNREYKYRFKDPRLFEYKAVGPRRIDESYLQSRIDQRKPSLYHKLIPLVGAGILGAAARKGYGQVRVNRAVNNLNNYLDSLQPGSLPWYRAMEQLSAQLGKPN